MAAAAQAALLKFQARVAPKAALARVPLVKFGERFAVAAASAVAAPAPL
jgi:hypothetical protein